MHHFNKIPLLLCFSCIFTFLMVQDVNAMYRHNIVIDEYIDLKGNTFKIQPGQKLIFKKNGCLMNGIVEGEMTDVSAGKKHIFQNIILKGSFTAEKAYSDWFDIIPDCKLDDKYRYISGTDNTQGFRNLFLFKSVVVEPGTYFISGDLSCMPSQEIEGNGATIKCLNKGICVSISSDGDSPISDVTLYNLNLVGSKPDYNDKTEYWHGINISYAENITIECVNISYCRGDGIYIGGLQKEEGDNRISKDIRLKNVKCLKNYRQGMSITRGKNIYVEGSSFSGTSGTLPYCGVDIEPNISLKTGVFNECENIIFSKCIFEDNDNPGLMISAKNYNSGAYDKMIKNIVVEDCTFRNNDICVYGVNGLTIRNCSLGNGEIRMTAYGRIQDVTLDGVKVEFNRQNHACGFQLALLEQPCRNISVANFEASNCGIFGLYVTRGRLTDNGKPMFLLDGLILKNIKISHCANSIFVSENVKNATYEGVTILNNGIDQSGNRMISKYGQNFFFEKLDDKNTRIER